MWLQKETCFSPDGKSESVSQSGRSSSVVYPGTQYRFSPDGTEDC